MPSGQMQPCSVSGLVKDENGTVVSDATVTLYDTLGNSTNITTQTDGSYSLSTSSFSTAPSAGDSMFIDVVYGTGACQRYAQVVFTVPDSMALYQDITLGFMDMVTQIGILLKDNWSSARTDNKTPIIDIKANYKTVDLQQNDFIGLYLVSSTDRASGLGDYYKDVIGTVAIDMETSRGYKHAVKILNEVIRILDANTKDLSGRSWMDIKDYRELSRGGIYRYVQTVEVWDLAVSRT